MKKTLITSALLASSLGVFAQGTIIFSDNSSAFEAHIYSPNPANPTVEQIGTGVGDKPTAGSTAFGGMKLGTGNTMTTGGFSYAVGGNFTVQLYALTGNNEPASALVPVTQYLSTIYTTTATAAAGLFTTASPSPDSGIPNTLGDAATVELAAWDNMGGTVTSLAEAIQDGVPYGTSQAVNDDALGNVGSPPGTATTLGPVGITSFSLVTSTPEPSTIALGVLGASSFLFRRKK